jgi:hypothetical protein
MYISYTFLLVNSSKLLSMSGKLRNSVKLSLCHMFSSIKGYMAELIILKGYGFG